MRNVLLIIGVLALFTGCTQNKGEITLKIDDGTGEPVKVLLNNDSEKQVVVNIYCKSDTKTPSNSNQKSNKENNSISFESSEKISVNNVKELNNLLSTMNENQMDEAFDRTMKNNNKRITLNNKDYSKAEVLYSLMSLLKRLGKGYKKEGNKIVSDSNYVVPNK